MERMEGSQVETVWWAWHGMAETCSMLLAPMSAGTLYLQCAAARCVGRCPCRAGPWPCHGRWLVHHAAGGRCVLPLIIQVVLPCTINVAWGHLLPAPEAAPAAAPAATTTTAAIATTHPIVPIIIELLLGCWPEATATTTAATALLHVEQEQDQ